MIEGFQAVIRPYIAALFATVASAGWLLGRLSDDAFIGMAGIAIGFYFQARGGAPANGA